MASVQEPESGPSDVDMGTDKHNPPVVFTHAEWCRVRDGLWEFGKPFKGDDHRRWLYKVALNMNLCQSNYGHQQKVLGTEGGRLFSERTVHYLLGRVAKKLPNGKMETLFIRIKLLKKTGHAELVGDLHALRVYGNRADHDELDDIAPSDKPVSSQCLVGACGLYAFASG